MNIIITAQCASCDETSCIDALLPIIAYESLVNTKEVRSEFYGELISVMVSPGVHDLNRLDD